MGLAKPAILKVTNPELVLPPPRRLLRPVRVPPKPILPEGPWLGPHRRTLAHLPGFTPWRHGRKVVGGNSAQSTSTYFYTIPGQWDYATLYVWGGGGGGGGSTYDWGQGGGNGSNGTESYIQNGAQNWTLVYAYGGTGGWGSYYNWYGSRASDGSWLYDDAGGVWSGSGGAGGQYGNTKGQDGGFGGYCYRNISRVGAGFTDNQQFYMRAGPNGSGGHGQNYGGNGSHGLTQLYYS